MANLRFWNGRTQNTFEHRSCTYYVAAYTVKQAMYMMALAAGKPMDTISYYEIQNYFHEGGWGRSMEDKRLKVTKPCCYVVAQNGVVVKYVENEK